MLLMPFSFNFNLSAPGLRNPFSAQVAVQSIPNQAEQVPSASSSRAEQAAEHQPARRNRRRPSPLPSIEPHSRKRGWVPSSAEPSLPATMSASSIGYLDTPSKYRVMAAAQQTPDEDAMIADMPPAKRRRGLTGSIISTALSAAVIGTAVGLTVYRLWRDRGKEIEHAPPPPYQEDWVDARLPPKVDEPRTTALAPPPTPTRHRRARSAAIPARRHIPHHRRLQNHVHGGSIGRDRTGVLFPPTTPQIDDVATPELDGEGGVVDEQMDWFGDKLSKLIEEGKRALGTEVVVMSEDQADEVDDGAGDWVEEGGSISYTSSIRRTHRRPANLDIFPSSVPSGFLSAPPTSRFRSGSTSGRSSNFDSAQSTPSSFPQTPLPRDDEVYSMSPELKESMERARSAYNQRRGLGLGP